MLKSKPKTPYLLDILFLLPSHCFLHLLYFFFFIVTISNNPAFVSVKKMPSVYKNCDEKGFCTHVEQFLLKMIRKIEKNKTKCVHVKV